VDYRVVWTPGADANLEDIAEYIGRDSRYYASVVVSQLRSAPRSLQKYPFKYRVVPEFNNVTLREVLVYDYRMIYEVIDDSVVIMMIVNSARNLAGLTSPDLN